MILWSTVNIRIFLVTWRLIGSTYNKAGCHLTPVTHTHTFQSKTFFVFIVKFSFGSKINLKILVEFLIFWVLKWLTWKPGVGPGTFLMEHVMTFRKLGQKTPTNPFHRLTVKKYPGTFRNQAQTPYTLFLDKNQPLTLYIHIFHIPITYLYIKK